MNSHGNGSPVTYTVTMSGQTRAILLALHQQAIGRGVGSEFIATVRRIVQRLTRDPLTFGEPLFRLPALQLAVRQGGIRDLVVVYAVHEQRPLVFIRAIKVLS
jgi:hypothetical protein